MDPYTDTKFSASKTKKRYGYILLVFSILSVCYFVLVTGRNWLKLGTPFEFGSHGTEKAVVILSGPFNVTGTVTFYQAKGHGPVTVSGSIQNLDPNALRGFHVHEFGDLSQGCLSAGPHFNPFSKTHGAPTDRNRHVGDLGNIKSDADGSAIFSFQDHQLRLNGPFSIVGRAVVIHAGTDDQGQGGNDESLKTGNAGARAACGVIGIAI